MISAFLILSFQSTNFPNILRLLFSTLDRGFLVLTLFVLDNDQVWAECSPALGLRSSSNIIDFATEKEITYSNIAFNADFICLTYCSPGS